MWIWVIFGIVGCIGVKYLCQWFLEPIYVSKQRLLLDSQSKTVGSKLQEPATCDLSIVIPAYNEATRLPLMFDEMCEFLRKRQEQQTFRYEIIVVNDCSSDETSDVVKTLMTTSNVRLIELNANRGKGGAIRQGVLQATGKYILMADADGATKFEDYQKLEDSIVTLDNASAGAVVVGSRAHLEQDAVAERSFLRNFLMHGFHFIVATLCVKTIRDTQCGFKLFNRKAAQFLFPPLHIERWAFDVELLYLAERNHIPIEEIAVRWQEIPGSKLNVISATLTMLRELILIRLCYVLGIWKETDGRFRLN